MKPNGLHGLIAEFAEAAPLLEAAKAAHAEGYRQVDAYSPLPVEGLAEAIGFTEDHVPAIAFVGGVVGGLVGFFLQFYSATIDYPLVLGGRPLNSWPAFVPVTFEMTVLGAALAAFFGMLVLNRLPRLIHPVFDVPDFDRAARDRFFLCVRASDPVFDRETTRRFLEGRAPLRVVELDESRWHTEDGA